MDPVTAKTRATKRAVDAEMGFIPGSRNQENFRVSIR